MNHIAQGAAPRHLRHGEVKELTRQVNGPVLVAGDPGYDDECRTINLMLTLEPAVVVGATSAADVQAAVRFAAENGLPVAVKTTGHQAVLPGHGAVLVTTHRMKDMFLDAQGRRARVSAGVVWREVVEAAWPHRLAPSVDRRRTSG